MKSTIYLLAFAIAFATLFSACSSVTVLLQPEKSDSYEYDRVLIVGLTTDYNLRSMVEEQLSYELRQMGYHLYSSVNVDEEKKELYTRDEVVQLAADKSLDGIMVVKLKDVESKERYSSNYNVDPYAMNNYFFYTNSYTGVYNWSYIQEKTVTIETVLFDVKTQKMIYQAEATYKNSGSQEEGASAFGKMFAKAYKSSGLLKKKE